MNVRWVEHQGKRILYVDYRHLSPEQMLATLEEEARLMLAELGRSIRLINLQDVPITNEFMARARELSRRVLTPKGGKVAVLGVDPSKELLLHAHNLYSGAGLTPFASEAEALAWLVE
jgi:hypothetical protein